MQMNKTKKLAIMAMLAAMAYISVFFFRIPAVAFLKYEPKDIIITLGGFILGPLSSVSISLIVSTVEMVSISDTGWIGLLMNFISTVAFAGTASFIYSKRKSFFSAIIGLLAGCIAMTTLMLVWNYLITPLYLGVPRETVSGMLLPIFLPFNLVKSGIDSTLTMMIYLPLSDALRHSRLFSDIGSEKIKINKKSNLIFVYSILVIILGTCVSYILLK